MKAAQHKDIFNAVRVNLEHHVETRGEGELIGVEDFTEEMFDLFETWFEREVRRLQA